MHLILDISLGQVHCIIIKQTYFHYLVERLLHVEIDSSLSMV